MKKKIISFIFIIVFIFVFSISMIEVKADEVDNGIHLIVTNPGEDSSKEMNINWHSINDGSYLLLSTSSDFSDATRIDPVSKLWNAKDVKGIDQTSTFVTTDRYVCSVSLSDLNPKTKYYYKVVCGSSASAVYHFSTAGLTDNWTFTAYTDFQCEFNTITHPLIDIVNGHANDPSLVVCSGDMFDVYGNEDEWKWLLDDEQFTNFTYSCGIGDHAYWGKYENDRVTSMKRPYTYMECMNNPKNGCTDLENTTFYYLYNNVLFISLDNGDSDTSSGTMFTNQVKWFKEVVKKMEGKFEYLVAIAHKSIYGSTKNDSSVATTLRSQWYPVFDECKVDLVLSGHDHEYSRTYPLYGNKVGNITKGTYYLDMGSSGDKRRAFDGSTVDKLHAKTMDIATLGISCGAVISVTDDNMNVKVYSTNDEVVDEFNVKPKRSALSIDCTDFDSSKLAETLSINYTDVINGKGVLNIKDTDNFRYVKNIEVMSGATYLYNGLYDSCKNGSSLELKNMSRTMSNYLVRVKLFDGTSYEQRINVDYGSIDGFELVFENNKLLVKANSNLIEGINYTYKLKQDGKSLKSFNKLPYELSSDLLFKDATYTLEVYDENQTLIASCDYTFTAKEGLNVTTPLNITLNVGEESTLNWTLFDPSLVEIEVSDSSVISYDEENKTIKAIKTGSSEVTVKVKNTNISQSVNVTVVAVETGCNKGFNLFTGILLVLSSCTTVLFLGFRKKENEK